MNQDSAVEIRNKDYIGYILQDSENVSHSSLQIIKRSDIDGIMKGYQLMQDGKMKILFDVGAYSSLDRVMDNVDAGTFVGLLLDVINVFHEIKYNTVLPIDTILLSANNVFVDQKRGRVKLLALPVKSQATIRERELFEKNTIYILSTMMYQSKHISDPACRGLYDDCQTGTLLLDDLYNFMKMGKYGNPATMKAASFGAPAASFGSAGSSAGSPASGFGASAPSAGTPAASFGPQAASFGTQAASFGTQAASFGTQAASFGTPAAAAPSGGRLLALLQPARESDPGITILKEQTVIGKSRTDADVRIDKQGVSRKHCEIILRGGSFYIRDLGSTNGTKVNGERLFADQFIPLNTGDTIEILDMRYTFTKC